MVDFGGMKDKAEALASEHGDQIKQGVDKGGDALDDRIGRDRVDGAQEKIDSAIDGLAGQQGQPEQAAQQDQH